MEPRATRRRRAPTGGLRGRAPSRARTSARSTRASRCSPTSSRCASAWPNASPAPVAPGPLPAVPTLVLDGDADLRTPVEDARALAPRIPGASSLEVPFVGHSVIGADSDRLRARRRRGVLRRPGRAARARRGAAVPADPRPRRRGWPSAAGRRARAQDRRTPPRETLSDVGARSSSAIAPTAQAAARRPQIGGLRAGTARWTATGIRLRRVQYVPGVLVSGFAPRSRRATTSVTVSGDGARARDRAHHPRRADRRPLRRPPGDDAAAGIAAPPRGRPQCAARSPRGRRGSGPLDRTERLR